MCSVLITTFKFYSPTVLSYCNKSVLLTKHFPRIYTVVIVLLIISHLLDDESDNCCREHSMFAVRTESHFLIVNFTTLLENICSCDSDVVSIDTKHASCLPNVFVVILVRTCEI